MAERELIQVPEWVIIHDVEGEIPIGQEYWHLRKLEFKPEEAAGGRHHIYIETPHDPTVRLLARNQFESFEIALDKPANEPAGNCPMYAKRFYSARLGGLAGSDWVEGMHMPSNLHVTYHLHYARRRKGSDEPAEPSPTTNEIAIHARLRELAPGKRALTLNPAATLQRRIAGDSFLPVSSEFTTTVAGQTITAQLADSPLSGIKSRIYYLTGNTPEGVKYIEL